MSLPSDEFVTVVDKFLEASKRLAGVDTPQIWQPARKAPELCIKVPIEVAGMQCGQWLEIVAPSVRADFSISLIFPPCVMRLDYEPNGHHANPANASRDGVAALVSGKHIHLWQQNRGLVTSDGALVKLKWAIDIPASIRNFDQALRYFCDAANIALPNGHYIELPHTLL